MKDAELDPFRLSRNPRCGAPHSQRRRSRNRSDTVSLSRSVAGLGSLFSLHVDDLSDQAIHIAAGMLFASYRGLIGMLWSITERVAPRVTRHYADERNMPSV